MEEEKKLRSDIRPLKQRVVKMDGKLFRSLAMCKYICVYLFATRNTSDLSEVNIHTNISKVAFQCIISFKPESYRFK